LDNLLYGNPTTEIRKEWLRLHSMITARFVDAGNLPNSFTWPINPMMM